jgi:uncharacterized membrane protein
VRVDPTERRAKTRRFLVGAFLVLFPVAAWVAAFELNLFWLILLAFGAELLSYWWLTRK